LPYLSQTQQALQNLGQTLQKMSTQRTETAAMKIQAELDRAKLGVEGAQIESQTKLGTLSALARLKSEESQQKYYDYQIGESERQKLAAEEKARQDADFIRVRPGGIKEIWAEKGVSPDWIKTVESIPAAATFFHMPASPKNAADLEKIIATVISENEKELRGEIESPKDIDAKLLNDIGQIDKFDKRLTALSIMYGELDRTSAISEYMMEQIKLDPEENAWMIEELGRNPILGQDIPQPTLDKMKARINQEISNINLFKPHYEKRAQDIIINRDILPQLESEMPAAKNPDVTVRDKSGIYLKSVNGKWIQTDVKEEVPIKQRRQQTLDLFKPSTNVLNIGR